MIHKHVSMNARDKSITDNARLQKVALNNGDVQQSVYNCDVTLRKTSSRPNDDHLMNLFVFQFDTNLQKNHEFQLEYVFWHNREEDDPIRSHDCLCKIAGNFTRRKAETKYRNEPFKDHLTGMASNQSAPPNNGKGIGKDKGGSAGLLLLA